MAAPDAAAARPPAEDDTGSFAETVAMPGHLLRRCQQIAVALFLHECRSLDLTPLQFAVLSAVADREGLDQAGLAGLVALDRTTVGVVLRGLERRGAVRRSRSERDGRAKRVALTESGRALLAAALPLVRHTQERLTAPLDAAERATLERLLLRLADGNNAASRAPLRPAAPAVTRRSGGAGA